MQQNILTEFIRWVDAYEEAMPPRCGGTFLVEACRFLDLKSIYQIEEHTIDLEFEFYAIIKPNDIGKNIFSLDYVTKKNIKIACCNSEEDQEKHEDALESHGIFIHRISNKELKKIVDFKVDRWTFSLNEIDRWIDIDLIKKR